MNKIFLRPLVVCLLSVSLFASCGGDNNNNNTPAQPSAPATPAAGQASTWTQLNETVTCDAANPADCAGSYGFTVNASGTYQVGPAPGGQTLTGNLTSDEIALLNQDVTRLQTDGLSGQPTCFTGSGNVGTLSTVNLTLNGASAVEVYKIDVPQESGCYLGNQNDAAQLYTDLNTVLVKYYITPFPPTTHAQIGTWGGDNAEVDVAQNTTSFKFNCANGTSDQALMVDSSGNFSVTGQYNVTSGPIIVGHPTQFTATFSGTISGDTMTLNVSYTGADGSTNSQQFTLTLGATPSLQQICST